jgi:hypothetical protein
VSLATFVALVNLATEIGGERTIGAFGLAQGDGPGEAVACLVTVEAETIWAAKHGVLHLLRAAPGRAARVVEEVALPALEFPADPGTGRVGRTALEGAFRIEVQDGDIFMRDPQPPRLRYGDRAFALLGGRGVD